MLGMTALGISTMGYLPIFTDSGLLQSLYLYYLVLL